MIVLLLVQDWLSCVDEARRISRAEDRLLLVYAFDSE
jgi:hypothetical protein